MSGPRPLQELRKLKPRAVIVGGGDLIRTDRGTVALDHLCVESSRRRDLKSRIRGRIYAGCHFLRGPGPWLPEAGWAGDAPAVYASVGVHELPHKESVRTAVSKVKAAWVRTHHARDHLMGAGLPHDCCTVAPDALFTLTELVDREALRAHGRQVLREASGQAEPTAVLHAAPFTGWTTERTVSVLREMRRVPTVALPLGRYAGEDIVLSEAARQTGVPFLGILPSNDITAVLAAAGCIVTTSMHAAIIGAGFERPVVVPGIEKTRSAFEACPKPPSVIYAVPEDIAMIVSEVLGQDVPWDSSGNIAAVRAAVSKLIANLDL